MVEDVVEVDAYFQPGIFAKSEILAHPEVNSPGTGTYERVSFGNVGVIKYVCTRGW